MTQGAPLGRLPSGGLSVLEKSSGLRRLLRYRLIVPILRGRRASQFTARGAAVGLAVAMTPTVGVQMIFCAGLWMLLRAIKPAWGFNLIVACAWTWITNVFTVGPFYYGFLVTGQLMLGNSDGLYGFSNFLADFNQVMAIETTESRGCGSIRWPFSMSGACRCSLAPCPGRRLAPGSVTPGASGFCASSVRPSAIN